MQGALLEKLKEKKRKTSFCRMSWKFNSQPPFYTSIRVAVHLHPLHCHLKLWEGCRDKRWNLQSKKRSKQADKTNKSLELSHPSTALFFIFKFQHWVLSPSLSLSLNSKGIYYFIKLSDPCKIVFWKGLWINYSCLNFKIIRLLKSFFKALRAHLFAWN